MAAQHRQGEVWDADLDEIDVETQQPKLRPAIIVGRDELIRGRLFLVVPTTSRHLDRRAQSNHVYLSAGVGGLSVDSLAQAHLVQPVDKTYLMRKRGVLPDEVLAEVLRAIMWSIDYFDDSP